MNVDDAPEPRHDEEPVRLHHVVLSRELHRRHIVLFEDVLIVRDVAIPRRRAEKQLRREVSDLACDFLCCDFDFVDDSGLG